MADHTLKEEDNGYSDLLNGVLERLITVENELLAFKEARATMAENITMIAVNQNRDHTNQHAFVTKLNETTERVNMLTRTVDDVRAEMDSINDSQERVELTLEWVRDNEPELNEYLEKLAAERAERMRVEGQARFNQMFARIDEMGLEIQMQGPNGERMNAREFFEQKFANGSSEPGSVLEETVMHLAGNVPHDQADEQSHNQTSEQSGDTRPESATE